MILERKKKNYQTYRYMKKENEEWKIAKSLVVAVMGDEEGQKREEQRRQQEQEKCIRNEEIRYESVVATVQSYRSFFICINFS